MIGAMRGWHGMRKARWWAGESSRCEDPAPTVGRLRGFRCDASPPTTICDHMGINGNGEWEGNDAARRVATSSGKWGNRI